MAEDTTLENSFSRNLLKEVMVQELSDKKKVSWEDLILLFLERINKQSTEELRLIKQKPSIDPLDVAMRQHYETCQKLSSQCYRALFQKTRQDKNHKPHNAKSNVYPLHASMSPSKKIGGPSYTNNIVSHGMLNRLQKEFNVNPLSTIDNQHHNPMAILALTLYSAWEGHHAAQTIENVARCFPPPTAAGIQNHHNNAKSSDPTSELINNLIIEETKLNKSQTQKVIQAALIDAQDVKVCPVIKIR